MKNQTISPRVHATDCDVCTGPESIDVMRFQRAIACASRSVSDR
jgi:hypothetical protein